MSRHSLMCCNSLWLIIVTCGILANSLPRVLTICDRSRQASHIRLEGSVTEHDVKIGSTLNITCIDRYPFSQWWKDDKRLLENDRVLWVQAEDDHEHKPHKRCFKKKVVIRNITKQDAGIYTCYGLKDFYKTLGHKTPGYSISINTVNCFQGHFCPTNKTKAQRCPAGKFSMHKNATFLHHCQPCPTTTRARVELRKNMESKMAAMFRTNCPDHFSLAATSGHLSTGAKIAIGVGALALVAIVIGGVVFVRKYKKSVDDAYKEKLFPKDVDLETPHVDRCNDVFICYSSKDSDWVQRTLHSRLKSQGFRTLIDFMDFEIGRAIHENIINAIYASRKTIFVLSSHSLKSFYARRELYQALAAGATGHQVIVVQYEKCKVPVEIVHAAYLDWTEQKKREERFWEKLFDAIKTPLANETVV